MFAINVLASENLGKQFNFYFRRPEDGILFVYGD